MKKALKRLTASAAMLLLLGGCAVVTRVPGPSPQPTGSDKVAVCHKGKKTLYIDAAALKAHLNHGDTRGRCP